MKWISCEDHVPGDSGSVLAFFPVYNYIMVARYEKVIWKDQMGNERLTDPSHWMPLPQKPDEGTCSVCQATGKMKEIIVLGSTHDVCVDSVACQKRELEKRGK